MAQMARLARIQVLTAALVLGVIPIVAAQPRPVTVDDILDLKGVGVADGLAGRDAGSLHGPQLGSPFGQGARSARVADPHLDRACLRRRRRPPDHVRTAGRFPAAVVTGRPLHQLRLGTGPRRGEDVRGRRSS